MPASLIRRKIMNRDLKPIIIAVIIAALFFVVASLPVSLIGCGARGLLAILIAIVAGVLAIAVAFRGLKGRVSGEEESVWWILCALILAMPAVYLVSSEV